jgi:SOS response regulatory protein OraA/RecX
MDSCTFNTLYYFMPEHSLKSKQLMTLAETKLKIMDLMAISDRSEKQLIDKLQFRVHPEILQEALDWAKTQSWNPSSDQLQKQIIENLNRKNKGQLAIQQKLKILGLQTVQIDPEIELEKARQSVETKFGKILRLKLDFKSALKEKTRVMRFLSGRGFDSDITEKVLNIYFKDTIDSTDSSEDIYDEEF